MTGEKTEIGRRLGLRDDKTRIREKKKKRAATRRKQPGDVLNRPRDPSKGKGVATEKPMKELIPYLEERSSNPTMPNPKSFSILEGHLTTKDILAQAREMKRLADLKDVKEKSNGSLKKMFNSATGKAQTQK
nr:hypothetical protein [Tanacetum cinerariifolium]